MCFERWEHGSEFHWLEYPQVTIASHVPWEAQNTFWGSGRDALRALLIHGQAERGWRRLWIPSYFCQDVVASLLTIDVEVVIYQDSPLDKGADLGQITVKPGDAILLVNFFGLRTQPDYKQLDRNRIEVIEDHSHDPWSAWAWQSEADWCIASLRKTLPVPDGGLLWSPQKHLLPRPSPVTAAHEQAALRKFAAATLKALYLDGHAIEKSVYRRLALSGEEAIVHSEISGMTEWAKNLIRTFPMDMWRERRASNFEILRDNLMSVPSLKVLQPIDRSAVCPFSGILVFNTARLCNYIRGQLIEVGVYPAVLWSLEQPCIGGIPAQHVDFSRRMLSLHCDMRYSESDMQQVAAFVRRFCEKPNIL